MANFNQFNYPQTAANTGYKKKPENFLSACRQLFICPANYTMATKTVAETQSTWTTAIKATKALRIYPFPLAVAVTPAKKEDVYQSRPLAGDKFIREQPIQIDFMLDVNKSAAIKLRKFNGRSVSCYMSDTNGNLIGWSTDGMIFNAFDVLEMRVGSQNFSDGSNAVETPVKLVLRDPRQWNDYGAVCQPTWDPTALEGLYDVNLTLTGMSNSGGTVSCYIDGTSSADAEAAVTGLVKGDLVLAKGGAGQTISTLTDNGDGTYALAGTYTTGSFTLDLVAAASVSLTAYGIEEVAQASNSY